jgi:heterodisulfide reductase subunit A-like polyferredoxin
LRHLFTPSNDQDPQKLLSSLVEKVMKCQDINLHLESKIVRASGFTGNFVSTLQGPGGRQEEIQHGTTILATGAQEYRGPEYGYGTHPSIITQQELETILVDRGTGMSHREFSHSHGDRFASVNRKSQILNRKSIVMIQCVGPAEKFCSRICCTVALKNALAVKERYPDTQVVVLYKDIRTYGFKERLYTTTRDKGVIFVRYDDDSKPEVVVDEDNTLIVKASDPILNRPLTLHPDLVVLSMPVVPNPDVGQMAAIYKVPTDADGDFATDGVFMAGMAHYPKLAEESMIQAQAAAARAARILSRETLTAGGRVAIVDESLCTGCLTCVRICPFGVPIMTPNLTGVGNITGAAHIEPAVCQGCGTCAAECPAQAIQLSHYTNQQMAAKVQALVRPKPGLIALETIKAVAN